MVPSILLFLDMGAGEFMLVALVIFIVLGPDKIPDIARKFGKTMRYIRKATDDIKREINIDEDLIQKPRSYSHIKKPAILDKVTASESETENIEAPVSESKDNKSEK